MEIPIAANGNPIRLLAKAAGTLNQLIVRPVTANRPIRPGCSPV